MAAKKSTKKSSQKKKASKKATKKKTSKKQAKKTASKKSSKKKTKKAASKKSSKKTTKKSGGKGTSKRITKKTISQTPQETTTKQPFPTTAVVVGVVFVALVILAATAFTMWAVPQQEAPVQEEEVVVAVVNGQAITQEDVDVIRSSLGQQATMFPEEQLVDQLILQTLLLQEAEVRGIVVTPQQAQQEFSALLEQQGVSEEEFSALLAQQGQDFNTLLEEYRKNLILEALAEEVVQGEITEEQAREFYQEYQEVAGEDTPPFEELEEEIYAFLREQQQAEALTALAEELRSQAQIERFTQQNESQTQN